MHSFFQSQLQLILALLCFLGLSLTDSKPLFAQPTYRIQPNQALKWQIGRNNYSVRLQGKDRHFIVYVPTGYQSQNPTAVVFMFHGTTGNGNRMYQHSRWKETAEQQNFIAVFPSSWQYFITSVGQQQTKWNIVGLQNLVPPGTQLLDDVGFVDVIINSLLETFYVNKRRIYASGFSNGAGFVATRLLPERSDIFAALSVGGGLLQQGLNMQGPSIPVFQMIGSNDQIVLNATGAPLPTNAAQWVGHPTYGPLLNNMLSTLGLGNNYTQQTGNFHSTITFAQGGGRGKLIFSVVPGMGHIYPNGNNNPFNLVVAQHYWNFFRSHPRP